MFGFKSRSKRLRERCANIETELTIVTNTACEAVSKRDLVECSVCGCLLRKWVAIKGKGEIRTETIWHVYGSEVREVIYHPYYCKVHAPKEEEPK